MSLLKIPLARVVTFIRFRLWRFHLCRCLYWLPVLSPTSVGGRLDLEQQHLCVFATCTSTYLGFLSLLLYTVSHRASTATIARACSGLISGLFLQHSFSVPGSSWKYATNGSCESTLSSSALSQLSLRKNSLQSPAKANVTCFCLTTLF